MNDFKFNMLADRSLSDAEVEDMLLQVLRKAHPDCPSVSLDPGQVLFREGDRLEHVYIRLSGVVKLTRNTIEEEVIFHAESAGRIIGLLALVTNEPEAFYTCTAKTGCTLLRFTQHELEEVLQSNSELMNYFLSTLIRNLASRNRRSVELQIDIRFLNKQIEEERDHLARALKELEQAQMKLVQSEKMATLGQLVAGVAHELNNPIAAISRAADFVHQDMDRLARTHPDGQTMLYFTERFESDRPLSSREQRRFRKELEQAGLETSLAARLVRMGIISIDEYRKHFDGLDEKAGETRLEDLENYFELCTFLRNIRAASKRIEKLVQSLRSYAKADTEITSGVNVYHGIEETLNLMAHNLREIEITKDYADLPLLECSPGQVNQVWTNLINNAVQAMHSKGHITIRTRAYPGFVEISITDNGPGIPPENLERIFEINFTTKQGKADFGIGLGLPICKQIVEQHGGRISVSSQPGETSFTVQLPVSRACENLEDSGELNQT